MDTLVTAKWLSRHINDPDLIVLDCSVTTMPEEDGGFYNVSARPEYEAGHLPGAGFADLKGDLWNMNSPIEFALPTPEHFCHVMGMLGVGDDSRVVLYDTSYTAWAARVWWMLRWVGFDNAAILDGGLAAWSSSGQALSLETVTHKNRILTPRPRPELIADHNEVMTSINDETITLIDTLPEIFYRGDQSIYGRPGHIPSAINIDTLKLLDKTGYFLSQDKLAALHKNLDYHNRVVTYCGGGIAASANAFVMHRLGFENIAVYTDSLQVWAADPNNPMTVGMEKMC